MDFQNFIIVIDEIWYSEIRFTYLQIVYITFLLLSSSSTSV